MLPLSWLQKVNYNHLEIGILKYIIGLLICYDVRGLFTTALGSKYCSK